MHPIFVAAAADAAVAGQKGLVTSAQFGESKKIHWFTGEYRYDKELFQELCLDIAQNKYHINDGQKLAVTHVESKEICLSLNHLKNALKCGAATALFSFSILTGMPLAIAGTLGLMSFAAGILEGFRAVKAPDVGYEHKPI